MHKSGPLGVVALAVVMGFSLQGCGLIFGHGAPQPLQVVTNPEGASLSIDGVPHDGELSPTTVFLHPKKDHYIEAKLPDGSKGQTFIHKSIRIPVVVMDGLLTLGIGLLVDYLAGSLYHFDAQVRINLGKAPPPTVTPPPTTTQPPPDSDAPCAICSEPRGDVTPCPHCGME